MSSVRIPQGVSDTAVTNTKVPQTRRSFIKRLQNASRSTKTLAITIWTFAAADMRTMVIPMLLLSVLSASAGPILTTRHTTITSTMRNIPQTSLWIWLNVLVISISNQRLPTGIIEDKINKPWRPIPAGMVNIAQAKHLLLCSVTILVLMGHYLDILYETLGCLGTNWIYNDLEGGDVHLLLRQLLNGVAYLPYGIGAMKLVIGDWNEPNAAFYLWIRVIAIVVGTTIQVQDLKDLDGDRAHHRHTIPVVVGDRFTRVSVCLGVSFWSVACPVFWKLDWWVCIPSLVLGVVVCLSVGFRRGQKADKMSFSLWSFWLISLFFLPLMKAW